MSLRKNQSGMVSIMVTMIMMLVISLIVLGFAQISRREQRQSLDRQLSTQAFLAAESGVNDARDTIRATLASGGDIQEKTECAPTPEYPITKANPIINAANQVSYPCLLVSTHLKDITVNPLTAGGNSVNVPVEPAIGTIGVLHVNVRALVKPTSQGQISSNCKKSGADYLPSTTSANWKCPYGIVRMDIVPTDNLDRASLDNGQRTIFLYPGGPGGTPTIDYSGADGQIAVMSCKITTDCDMTIANMPSSGSTNYAIRLNSIYVDTAVSITADNAGGASLELKNAQVQVDATGKAQDVLRRVQVRVPLTNGHKTPDFALESGSSVCKRFEITTNTFKIPGTISGQDSNNPMCRPASVAPPLTGVVACVNRGPNRVTNGDFAAGAGNLSTINPALYGFSTNLPNRGPDTFPDDDGVNGSTPDTRGWGGGLSVQTSPKMLNPPYVLIKQFPGDNTVNPAVPVTNTSMLTNPNQSLSQPKGTNLAATYTGPLWMTTLNGLKPNTKYDFSGYFANVLTDAFFAVLPTAFSAKIEFTIDGTIVRPAQVMSPSQSTWQRLTLTFTTGPAQTTADFQIVDLTGDRTGDDFAMTQLGVYECL